MQSENDLQKGILKLDLLDLSDRLYFILFEGSTYRKVFNLIVKRGKLY